MKFAAITVLALVILQVANTQRVLMIQDNNDDCFNAYKSFTTDIQEVIADVKKQDFPSAISVVMTKLAPEVQALQKGDMVCYTKIMGDLVGEKCAAEVVKFGEDVMKYQQSKNMADLIAAIGDFTQGMTDCQGHKLSFTSFMIKDNNDDCFNAYTAFRTDIQEVIADVKKQDFMSAISVVQAKIVPEVHALQSGDMGCYTKIAGDLVGQKCAAEVVKFGEDVMKFQQSKNIADLMAAIGDFTQGMTDCQGHKLALNATVNCDVEVQEVVAQIPAIVGHLKSQNYIALIGDISSVKGHIDTIIASCVTSSPACTTIENSMGTNLNNFYYDVVSGADKATVEKHGTALADNLFDWRSTCFAKPQ